MKDKTAEKTACASEKPFSKILKDKPSGMKREFESEEER